MVSSLIAYVIKDKDEKYGKNIYGIQLYLEGRYLFDIS